jgi:hypothetical protein
MITYQLHKICLTILFLCHVVTVNALTFTSVRNGKWENPCTWGSPVGCPGTPPVAIIGVNIPGPNDQVIIVNSITVDATTKTVYGNGVIQVLGVEVSGNNRLTVTGTGVRLNVYQGSSASKCNLLFSSNNSDIAINNGAFVDVQGGMCVRTCSTSPNAINTTGGGSIRLGGCIDCGNGAYTSTAADLVDCQTQNTVGAGLNFCVICNISKSGCTFTAQSNIGGVPGCTAIILLPVNFISVGAIYQQKEASVLVSWATSSEKNNEKFEVERSLDGLTYQTIGTIPSSVVNSSSTLYYQYVDKILPKANTIYYRLKQYDLDGQFSYSKIVVVQRPEKIAYSNVYPNPSEDGGVFISLDGDESKKMIVRYVTMQGITVLENELAGVTGITKFHPTIQLPTGSYLVIIETQENVFYHRLVITR